MIALPAPTSGTKPSGRRPAEPVWASALAPSTPPRSPCSAAASATAANASDASSSVVSRSVSLA